MICMYDILPMFISEFWCQGVFSRSTHIIYSRASEASETLIGLNNGNQRYIYYKYSTLPRGISINIAPKVGIFPEAEGRGKYSLPRVQYYRYSTRKG